MCVMPKSFAAYGNSHASPFSLLPLPLFSPFHLQCKPIMTFDLRNRALRFSYCAEICAIVEGAHHHMYCYQMVGRVFLDMKFHITFFNRV